MVAAKPDCTKQQFGWLTVLGKAEIVKEKSKNPNAKKKTRSRQLWLLRCDLCGKLLKLPRGDFDRVKGGQKSCGCARGKGLIDNQRRPQDITGQKIGLLTAVELTGRKIKNQPAWLFQCECKSFCEMSLKQANQKQRMQKRPIHCGSPAHGKGFWYPPIPSPLPQEVGAIIGKYLYLAQSRHKQNDSLVEDAKVDRLIRAAWILHYRKSRGEEFSELKEKRFINKHLRYCSIDVFWNRKTEQYGGLLYNVSGIKKQIRIGDEMTDPTSSFEAVNPTGETQPENRLPAKRSPKKYRFKRC